METIVQRSCSSIQAFFCIEQGIIDCMYSLKFAVITSAKIYPILHRCSECGFWHSVIKHQRHVSYIFILNNYNKALQWKQRLLIWLSRWVRINTKLSLKNKAEVMRKQMLLERTTIILSSICKITYNKFVYIGNHVPMKLIMNIIAKINWQ